MSAGERTGSTIVGTVFGTALVVALAAPAALRAQGASPPAARAEESLAFERMESGFVAMPDVRFTEVDGRFGNLVGATAGWLTDDALFIGGGGYWLTNGGRDRGLSYGGLVVEWSVGRSRRLGASVRGLVGFGNGTLGVEVQGVPWGLDRRHRRLPEGGTTPQTFTALVDKGFFVAEPEARATLLLARWLRVGAGVGYRLIGGAGSFDHRLHGVTGTVSVQVGSF